MNKRFSWLSVRFVRQNLRVKIAFFALLVGILPLAATSIYTYYQNQKLLEQSGHNQVDARVDKLKKEIEDYFGKSDTSLLSIASSPAWLYYYTEPKQRDKWLSEQQDSFTYFNHVSGAGIIGFSFIDEAGWANWRVLSGSIRQGSHEPAALPFSQDSLSSNKIFISKPYLSPKAKLWVSATVTPVIGPDGKRLAELVAERPVSQILNLLRQETHFGNEAAFILNADQTVLLSSATDIDNAATTLAAALPDRLAASADKGGSNNQASYAPGNGSVFPKQSADYYLASRELDLGTSNSNKFTVALAVPRAALVQTSGTLSLFTLLIAGIFIIVILMSVLLSDTITRPILSLAATAAKVAGGDLSEKADLREENELGALAAAFNEMTGNLRQMVESETAIKEHLQTTVTQYKEFVEKVADGNLMERLSINGQDDQLTALGLNLNIMVESLSRMALDVKQATTNISTASDDILAAVSQHNEGAKNQAATVKDTTGTVHEVRASAEQTDGLAGSVSAAAQKTLSSSDEGIEAVETSIEAMVKIEGKVKQIADSIVALSEQTQQIGAIIATVNDIAEQSNLLALNASIEAARAGAEGKGFAVVAQEVRNLAEQSQLATAQVKSILDVIQKATNSVVVVTEEGAKDVQAGVGLARSAGETIRTMVKAINESSQAAQQIADAARQQARDIDRIADAIQNISSVTENTVASTKQTEDAVMSLTTLAEQLNESVSVYKLS